MNFDARTTNKGVIKNLIPATIITLLAELVKLKKIELTEKVVEEIRCSEGRVREWVNKLHKEGLLHIINPEDNKQVRIYRLSNTIEAKFKIEKYFDSIKKHDCLLLLFGRFHNSPFNKDKVLQELLFCPRCGKKNGLVRDDKSS